MSFALQASFRRGGNTAKIRDAEYGDEIHAPDGRRIQSRREVSGCACANEGCQGLIGAEQLACMLFATSNEHSTVGSLIRVGEINR